MMQSEFEALLRHAVTPEEFDAANEMCMSCELNQADFVKEYKTHRLGESEAVAGMVAELKAKTAEIRSLSIKLDNANEALDTDRAHMAMFLIEQDGLHSSDALRGKAIELVGEQRYLRLKLAHGLPLDMQDSEIVGRILNGLASRANPAK